MLRVGGVDASPATIPVATTFDAQTASITHPLCAIFAFMDTDLAALFVEVARARSFTAVAGRRGVDPSTISRAIGNLEARLGVRLLRRTSRSMTLTEAGELYLRRLPELLEGWQRLQEDAAPERSQPRGLVRLTASVALGQRQIVPLLGDLSRRYPDLRLEGVFSDEWVDLVAQGFDLAVRLSDDTRLAGRGERLFATTYRVVASPGYVERRGCPERPFDLIGHDCLVYPLPDYRSRWRFRSADAPQEEVTIEPKLILSNGLAIRQAASDGLGVALLANWLIDADIKSGDLIDLFPKHEVGAASFETSAWLLFASRDYVPKRVRVVADVLRDRLRSLELGEAGKGPSLA